MKKILKMFLSVLLCTAMCMTSICPVFAEEYDENQNGNPLTGDFETSEDIPEYAEDDSFVGGVTWVDDSAEAGYSIAVDKSKISFGTHTVGSVIDVQEFTISNTGSSDVNIIWKDVDPENAFVVDMTHAVSIPAGQSSDVHVSVATNKGAGAYSAVLQFADASDPAYDDGVKVELSVTIEEAEAKVKKIILKPGTASTIPGSSVDFFAEVEGEGDYDKTVTYSVKGNKSSSTVIDGNGHLLIGSDEAAGSFSVIAQSNSDPSVSASANVEVKNDEYSVSISSSPIDGGEVSGSGTYTKGSTVQLSAYPRNGWVFDGWTINGKDAGDCATYTIENVSSSYTAVAHFKQDYIRIKAKTNHDHMGYVEGDGYYEIGDTVTLKAVAEDGYKFSCWMEGKKKISKDRKLVIKNVDRDREFKAVFAKDECVVKVATCDETMGKVSGGGKISYGDDVTIKATPNSGYQFVKWLCNDQKVSESAEYKLKDVCDDITLVAIFEPIQREIVTKLATIKAGTTDTNGIISPSGAVTVEEGKSVNFTITPKSGYKIAAIAVDGKQIQVTNSFTFSNVHGDHTVVAAFLPIQNVTVVTKDKKEQSAKAAENSDINKESPVGSKKKYDENVMKMDNAPDKASESKDSMDNDLDGQEGVLQSLNMTDEEGDAAIRDDEKKIELVRTAVADESLQVNVSNDMRAVPMPVEYGDDAMNDPEVANFVHTVCGLFTDDEMQKLVRGDADVSISISVAGTEEEFVPKVQRETIESELSSDDTIGKYFYISFTKTFNGVSSVISELSDEVMVKVDIPDNIYKDGREFSIARLHKNGSLDEVSVLEDLDDDPHTITFRTDRFSTYAIVYNGDGIRDVATVEKAADELMDSQAVDSNKANGGMAKVIIIIIGIAAALSVSLTLLFGKKPNKKKRRRK